MAKGTISELVYVHIQNTSAHGLPNMLRAKSLLGKVIWFLLFVAGIGALTWQIADRLDRFFSNEYAVKLDINFSKEVPFPAVTFCNMNPLRTSVIKSDASGSLYDILHAGEAAPVDEPSQDSPLDPAARKRKRRQLPRQVMPTTMTPEDMTTEEVQSWDSRAVPEFFSARSEKFAIRERLSNALSRLKEGEKLSLGHQLPTMLLKCDWQGYPCAPDNFTTFFNSQYGNCFTFGRNNTDELKSNHPGPQNGLSLELFIEHDEYLSAIADTAGIVLVVHEPDKMPLPEDDGIQISTGSSTAVGIKQLKLSRLGLPYANCTHKDEVHSAGQPDYYRETFATSYSLKTCERSCYQDAVIRNCSCADSAYPSSPHIKYEPCNTANLTLCRSLVQEAYRAGEVACDCFNPCEETVYIPSISVAYWPSDVIQKDVFAEIKQTNKEARLFLLQEGDPGEWLEKNVAKVQIFFQEFNYETISQSPSYTLGDLLSDVGGQLGLWLGISVLSMFEILETMSAVGVFLWHGAKRSGKLEKRPSTPIQVIKPPIRPTMSDNPESLFPPVN